MEKNQKSVFEVLNAINVNEHTEKKNNLTYLSWAWAWAEVKKHYPDAFYTIYENRDGLNYHTDGRTCWVKTGVTINGLEHIEYLPVMDFRNASISYDKVTSYGAYQHIQEIIYRIYNELREEKAKELYGKSLSELDKTELDTVYKAYPINVVEVTD